MAADAGEVALTARNASIEDLVVLLRGQQARKVAWSRPPRRSGPRAGCWCSPAARWRYLGRLSGPLLDRVDVKVSLRPASREDLLAGRPSGERSAAVAQRAMELGQVSARGADQIVRVAWSLADLAARDQPGPDEVSRAIGRYLGMAR